MLYALIEALRPFAAIRLGDSREVASDDSAVLAGTGASGVLTVGNFRAARAAIAQWDSARLHDEVPAGRYVGNDVHGFAELIVLTTAALSSDGAVVVVAWDPRADRVRTLPLDDPRPGVGWRAAGGVANYRWAGA